MTTELKNENEVKNVSRIGNVVDHVAKIENEANQKKEKFVQGKRQMFYFPKRKTIFFRSNFKFLANYSKINFRSKEVEKPGDKSRERFRPDKERKR